MLRGSTFASHRLFGGGVVVSLACARRGVRYANIQEALKPQPGHSAGQMSILNEICCNPDAEEERRKPIFRMEVAPWRTSRSPTRSYLRSMYEWGYNSLTLFHKVNEDPGPWWNANSSTLVSNWSQVGDYANAGMWSGVWRYTYGIGEYNLRPYEARGRAWGRRAGAEGALKIQYYPKPREGKNEGAALPPQRLMFPHTPEHAMHRRLKNPPLPGCREIGALHGKRILREIQYHLGQGLRFYLIDGVFGSHPGTHTPYRIITDNPTHAYFASLAAIRKFNYVAQQEIMLCKRVSQSPMDEWGWRRPGVLVYHAPSWDFERPRIVEEFGGPRPQDLGLDHPKFIALEPYSIPMKAAMASEPSCDALLDTTAFLCARWGFYADDAAYLTVCGESLCSPDARRLTLVLNCAEADADVLRASPLLFGARHHRIGGGFVSRAWDVTSAAMAPAAYDFIEEGSGRVHRALSTRLGLPAARSHRHFGRRHVTGFGYKWPHHYTAEAATRAAAGGHLFSRPKTDALAAHPTRPNAFALGEVEVVVIAAGTDAAAAVVEGLKARGMLYAEEDKLREAFAAALRGVKKLHLVEPKAAAERLKSLAKSGAA